MVEGCRQVITPGLVYKQDLQGVMIYPAGIPPPLHPHLDPNTQTLESRPTQQPRYHGVSDAACFLLPQSKRNNLCCYPLGGVHTWNITKQHIYRMPYRICHELMYCIFIQTVLYMYSNPNRIVPSLFCRPIEKINSVKRELRWSPGCLQNDSPL